MKKLMIFFFIFLFSISSSFGVEVYQEKNKFGLKNGETIILDAKYKKLIRLGESSFIALKGSKYGVVNSEGKTLIDFKYSHAARVLGKYVKLKNGKGYGLYDEHGNIIISQDKDSIELLFGGMFLVNKNYKYGVVDMEGRQLIDYVADDIYMPKPNIMRVKYNNEWYEIEKVTASTLTLPNDVKNIKENEEFKITKLITSPVAASKYSLVTTADYSIKIFYSISPAYEATIDELMLSQGAEAVSIFMKIGWLPKFPVVYFKNYFKILRNPVNGPLSGMKEEIKQEL